MRHKWVNLILLTLVAGELVTGAVGLMSGNSQNEIVLQAHSVLGYSIIAVFAWKTALALHSLKRPARGRPRNVAIVVSVLLFDGAERRRGFGALGDFGRSKESRA